MSYILEALKKSQQERDLGHVPTLETPAFLSQEAVERPSPWVLSAVILAVLAVAIALYSALRGSPPTPDAVEITAKAAGSVPPARETADIAVEPLAASAASRTDSDLVDPRGGALVPPMPKEADSVTPDATVLMQAPAVAAPSAPALQPFEASSPMDVPPPEAMSREVPERPRVPVSAQGTPVPQDLLADIEAFKQEVRKAQSVETSAKKKTAKKTSTVKPRDLRLPKDVRARMPELVMSAHIYDKEPVKRFVLINGVKVREGQASREEIEVEQILPDGAVLSFDGHRFFQRR